MRNDTPQQEGFAWWPTETIRQEANWTRLVQFAKVESYDVLLQRSASEPQWFWNTVIAYLDFRFYRPYDTVLDESRGQQQPQWCVGGTTNLVLNLLDKRTGAERQATAIICEAEDGQVTQWSLAELDAEVCRLAAGLARLGLKQGDVVGMFMPAIPHAVAGMLAIMKLGCIAMPLFSGYGAQALADRLNIAEAAAILTVDGTTRRGQAVPMKAVVDEAVASVPSVRHVVYLDRFGWAPAHRSEFDIGWQDLVLNEDPAYPTAQVPADHPALLIFTSGTTGKPKGIVHSHCGLGVKMGMDTQLAWDFKAGDRVQYMVDFGWLGGPMVTVGTLLAGAAFVMTEGAPDFPEPCRYWRVAQQFGSTILGLAPTLARGLRRHGQAETERYDFSSLRLIAVSGEPCDAETWTWISRTLGKGRVPLVNLSGGTEIGGILSANILFPMKPGAMHGAIPGTGADIVDAQGRSVPAGQLGELVMRQPCIGTARGLWREPQRFVESYFAPIPGMWAHGDLAIRDADGSWFIHGRSDDTLKVAGKRVGPAEVEAALLATGRINDAAVVAVDDAVKGSAIVCVVVPGAISSNEHELAELLSAAVVDGMGASFRPKAILFAADLPRTRNMKVMRRVVRAVLTGGNAGELSALHNPQAVDALRRTAAAAGFQVEGVAA